MFLLIEFVVSALIVPLALFASPLGNRLFKPIGRKVSRFATHRTAAVLAILFLALLTRILVLKVEPIPKPWFYDEFSYLLMADTFSHGRLTNPAHVMWKHFETFHVNQVPTYCSMYYPAQGLFLTFGQKFMGHPFWGVWLSTGLMCASFCWALQAWVPPKWAFIGAGLAIIRLGTFSYWADSYWGGSVAALGGALVLGALPRIQHYRRLRDAVVMGIGLAILANSRPYESIFYTAPILLALGWSMLNSDKLIREKYWRSVAIPLTLILVLTLSAMAYYFKGCTGSPLTTPYLVNVRTYETAPMFPWQQLNTSITYRHLSMAQYQLGWPVQEYERARHDISANFLMRLVKASVFFSGPLLLLPWFVLGVILPYGLSASDLGRKTVFLMGISLLSILGMCLPIYFESHYAAPACCTLYALEVQALRRVYIFDWKGRQAGRLLVRYTILACLMLFGLRATSRLFHLPAPASWFRDWESGGGQGLGRGLVESKLEKEPGQHLVFVRYSPAHDSHSEWVYNGADIDNSKIVWARDMGPVQNAELVRYFSSRKVWLLEPDPVPLRIAPYAPKQAVGNPDQSAETGAGLKLGATWFASTGK